MNVHLHNLQQYAEAVSQNIQYVFLFMWKWLSKSFFFTSRELQKQPLSYIMIVFSGGCQPHLPLSASLFPSQEGFTCFLLVSPCAPTSPKGKGRKAGIPLALFWKTCDCATHDIMALELVPYPHAFIYGFYFTSHTVGECNTSFRVFSSSDTLCCIKSLTLWIRLKLLCCSVWSMQKDKGKKRMCECARIHVCMLRRK